MEDQPLVASNDLRTVGAPLTGDLMRVRADIVGQDAIARELFTQDVEYLMGGKPAADRTQRTIERNTMLAPGLCRPQVGDCRKFCHRGDCRIQATRLIPDKRDLAAILSRFGANMHDRSLPDPLLIIYFDRVVTHCNDQVGLIDETFDIGSARPPDHTCPTGMAFRQKALAMKRRHERDLLLFDEPQKFIGGVVSTKGKSGHHQRPLRFLERLRKCFNHRRGTVCKLVRWEGLTQLFNDTGLSHVFG